MCDTEELQRELELLMKEYEKAAQQRVLVQHERQDVAEVMVVNTIASDKLVEAKARWSQDVETLSQKI